MRLGILVLVACGACSISTRKHVTRIELGAAVAAVACDWNQTRGAAGAGWRFPDGTTQHEENPIMGSHPSAHVVDAYMLTSIAAIIAGHYLLPESWQPYIYGGVLALEARSLAINADTTPGLCGFEGSPVMNR